MSPFNSFHAVGEQNGSDRKVQSLVRVEFPDGLSDWHPFCAPSKCKYKYTTGRKEQSKLTQLVARIYRLPRFNSKGRLVLVTFYHKHQFFKRRKTFLLKLLLWVLVYPRTQVVANLDQFNCNVSYDENKQNTVYS